VDLIVTLHAITCGLLIFLESPPPSSSRFMWPTPTLCYDTLHLGRNLPLAHFSALLVLFLVSRLFILFSDVDILCAAPAYTVRQQLARQTHNLSAPSAAHRYQVLDLPCPNLVPVLALYL
jgi:hypothetical protein